MRNLSDPRTRARALRPGARAHGARSSRRSAETQAELFRNLDTTFARARRRRAPYMQDSISGGPPALDAAIQELPAAAARSWPTARRSSASCARASRALRTAAPDLADALRDRHADAEALRRRSTSASSPTFEALAALRRGPARHARRRRPDAARATILDPTLADLTPAQTVCNYVDALVPQRRRACSARATRNGTCAALHHRRRAAGPEQRGRPVVARRPTAAPGRDNYLHTNPYPNTAVAGPAEGVRGGQRDVRRRASRSSATCRATRARATTRRREPRRK